MKLKTMTLLALVLAVSAQDAAAQTFSARRMGMGGVVLSAAGATGSNVAYRAVPQDPSNARSLSLPIGLIPVLADPPQLDFGAADFNIFDLANLLYTVPWNLQLTEPEPISSDVTISISQGSLTVDLGQVKDVFPEGHSLIGTVINGPSLGFGVRNVFVGVLPVVHYENDMNLNDALQSALADAVPFVPNTEYAMFDKAKSQAAAGAELGAALPLLRGGTHPADRDGFYVGTRVKVLRGLGYGDVDSKVGFTTGDTLFTNPVDINLTGTMRRAGPSDGGWGAGLDLGAVWVSNGLEIGVGANDVGTQIGWKVRESQIYNDPVSGDYVEQVLREQVPFTSHIPTVITVNAALPLGRFLIAGDVVSGVNNTQGHLGTEFWAGSWALRAGGYVDATRLLQASCGTGVRFGRFGLDAALSSHSRNLSQQRVLELGAGLSFYH
jgi:hypothetical protein